MKEQESIPASLVSAIFQGSLQKVKNIFEGNEDSNIQKILRLVWTSNELRNTLLRLAIDFYNIQGQKEGIEIIELIWQKADQRTRDFLCCEEYNLAAGGSVNVINMLKNLQEQGRTNDSNNGPALKEVIQEMEEHKRVKDLGSNLQKAIRSLDVNQVKAALENCGEDVKSVLEQHVYWNNNEEENALLIYPLEVEYSKELNQDDVKNIKEIFGLMFNVASPQLLRFELNKNNYVMDKLTCAQKSFAKIPGVGEQCFQDLIQEFEENLSRDILDNAKTDDQIAWDKEYATRFSQEINQDPSENDDLDFMDDTDLGQNPVINTANPELTNEADSKTPEKNDTIFWSEHKGKIALGVTGLCVAGAIAAYVLAYPAVALALAVLAAVILMGAGIAKVLEDPNVEKPFTPQQEVH